MKKIKLGLFLAGLVVLSGCAGIEETYKVGEFHTAEFRDNYYRFIPEQYKKTNYVETVHEIDISQTDRLFYETIDWGGHAFNTIISSDILKNLITLEEVIELYGDATTKSIKPEQFGGNTIAYLDAILAALRSSQLARWDNYADQNSLSTGDFGEAINNAFKKGVFSKLTDTIVMCDTTGSLVRIQIDEAGMGQKFDHELIKYHNFILTARGGTTLSATDISEGASGIDPSDWQSEYAPRLSYAKVRINVSFYIEKSSTDPVARKETITFIVDNLETDNSAKVTAMTVDLTKVMSAETLKRTSGMTINYELLEHVLLKPNPAVHAEPLVEDGEFALMLYEVMFPYASWH